MKNSNRTLLIKKFIFILVFCLHIISCETNIGFDDIEIREENGVTVGYLKSDNSLFTGDIIEFYRLQTDVDFNSATGESYPEYEIYPTREVHFKNGLASDVWRWYHDEGLIGTEISYKNGKYHGVFQEWNELGVLLISEIWEEGELIFTKEFE
ncbi:hypothetical protein [uncultured Polaribacter sp.]|uniref:toxin-antitoxin system YwqK family antitoxin n=1 Tax=uncultured Polaribacter sp. TaxID=174711 RepID=UPI0026296DCF|nr:hypothetical protein [uncultured Polaribacter sp.]